MDETLLQDQVPAPIPATPVQAPPVQPAPVMQQPPPALVCPQCHQPLKPEYYFCPNCGKKLTEPPLSTSFGAQVALYTFSIILPIIAFLAISYWQGIKYARSDDPKAQEMGWIAIALISFSTIITFWLSAVWIEGFIKSATSTAGLSQLGF